MLLAAFENEWLLYGALVPGASNVSIQRMTQKDDVSQMLS
jgi:hypothetical protein